MTIGGVLYFSGARQVNRRYMDVPLGPYECTYRSQKTRNVQNLG